MTTFTSPASSTEPPYLHQLCHELKKAGFRRCQQPPEFSGTLYMCELPQGFTYVVLPPAPSDMVEAFVGDWMMPQRYFHGPARGLKQLLHLLSQ